MAQCLLGMHKTLGSVPTLHKTGVVVHTCNPNSSKHVEREDQKFKTVFDDNIRFKSGLGYVRLHGFTSNAREGAPCRCGRCELRVCVCKWAVCLGGGGAQRHCKSVWYAWRLVWSESMPLSGCSWYPRVFCLRV